MLTESNCISAGEDLIIWVTVGPQCCILETNLRLYINATSIKTSIKKVKINKKEKAGKAGRGGSGCIP